jgi:hypothetical protein
MTSQLLPIDAGTPGRLGLNFQKQNSLLPFIWATEATNCRMDSAQRLAIRDGYAVTTAENARTSSLLIKSTFEYLKGDGAVETVFATDDNLYKNPDNPAPIKGSLTITDGSWYFQNFNNKCLGFQNGSKPIVYTGTTFAVITESSGTAPTSKDGIALTAYGRVWVLDSDGQTIKYSSLLDETNWGGAGAGQIDMASVWTNGMDEVKAIAAFNGSLLVFGKNHVVIWEDDLGSTIGVNPSSLAVVDVIEGTGCISHWTISLIGETDIVFMSRNGLQSLGRILQEKSNPLRTVSKYVRDRLVLDATSSNVLDLRSSYSPEEGLYLLSIPSSNILYTFDVRNMIKDEEQDIIFPCYQWVFKNSSGNFFSPYSLCVTQAGALLLGSNTGEIYTYGAATDNGSVISFKYASPWLDLGPDLNSRKKMLKQISSVLNISVNSNVFFKWSTDFNNKENSISKRLEAPTTAEWGIAEWGLSEFSGGKKLTILDLPARQTGQYYKIKIQTETTGDFAVEQLKLFAKIGRLT